jgi:peptide/nickel transport system ATP-binding protein
MSNRAAILDLLDDVAARFGITYLFISHDLAAVRSIADRVLVMQKGRIVEEGGAAEIFAAPRHPYTAALVAAAPDLDRAIRQREAAS